MLIFLRDWHPVLREPLDLSASASRSAIFALQGEHDAAMRLVFPGVAVFAVRAIDVPRAVDRVFCTAMFFQGWGNALHLFSAFWWYRQQRSHHLPMSLAPILYIGFARLGDVVPAPAGCAGSDSELCGMTLITCCLGVTAASFYEIYDWVVDHWFGRICSSARPTRSPPRRRVPAGGPWRAVLPAWALTRYTNRRLSLSLRAELVKDALRTIARRRRRPRSCRGCCARGTRAGSRSACRRPGPRLARTGRMAPGFSRRAVT